jgi:type II secretory ATPase GspE/PulE/Tfp pilus assembly ATPase PilB-like protein
VCELFEITPQIISLINRDTDQQTLKKAAIAEGMPTLNTNVLELARSGKTSLEEVFAVRLE